MGKKPRNRFPVTWASNTPYAVCVLGERGDWGTQAPGTQISMNLRSPHSAKKGKAMRRPEWSLLLKSRSRNKSSRSEIRGERRR